ncbi:zinc metalloproteinase nas-4-like [Argopecten irradians]|uniref:zinc metalloproteinase nas-4-like n=1 Tax=Argopecten irradians TaxID=31199 RepID=UPI003713C263
MTSNNIAFSAAVGLHRLPESGDCTRVVLDSVPAIAIESKKMLPDPYGTICGLSFLDRYWGCMCRGFSRFCTVLWTVVSCVMRVWVPRRNEKPSLWHAVQRPGIACSLEMSTSLLLAFLLFMISLLPNQTTSQTQRSLIQQLLQALRPRETQFQAAAPLTIDEEIIQAVGADVFNSDMSDPETGTVVFQGDIVLKYGDLNGALVPEESVNDVTLRRKKRKTTSDGTKGWPRGEILIAFDSNAQFILSDTLIAPMQRQEFQESLNSWQQKTCVRFRTPTINDIHQGRSFVFVQNGRGCSSPLGMNPMRQTGMFKYQPLTLAPNCRKKRIIMHEVGHALGLIHEQSRYDRDRYVLIQWNNVDISMRHNFQQFTHQVTDNRGTDYDYQSLMHYGPKAFSTNGNPTLQTVDPSYQDRIGAYTEISQLDAEAINNMYNCRAPMQTVFHPFFGMVHGKKKK